MAAKRRSTGSDLAVSMPVDYDSAAPTSPMIQELVELWRFRHLVVQLVRRDLVARYKRSLLGVLWTMLNPLGTMLVLAVVFSQAFGLRRGYAAYVLAGLLAWNFFSQSTLSAMHQLSAAAYLLQRIHVPRTVFVVTATGTALVNLLASLVPLAAIMLVTGVAIRPSVLFLPVSLLVLATFSLGIGLILSRLAVYFTDIAELYTVLLPALLYATPIIYPRDIIPEAVRPWLVSANPIHHVVALFRAPLYDGRLPDPASALVAASAALVMLAVGWYVFTARDDEVAEPD